MAIYTFYLDPEDADETVISNPEMVALAKAFKGKTTRIEIAKGDVKDAKITDPKAIQKAVLIAIKSVGGLKKAARDVLISKGKFDGKITTGGDHDFCVTVRGARLKGTLEVVIPVESVAYVPTEGTDFTFANGTVKANCDKNFIIKIKSICLAGPGETGHGKVPYLKNALHAHVTHTQSVAWVWNGKKVHVVATGVKNTKNPTAVPPGETKKVKTMSYDWTTK